MTLEQVEVGAEGTVVAIEGGRGVRAHLGSLGIQVGDRVRVVDRAPFRGPVLVEVHGTRVALGRGVARRVRVAADAAGSGGSAQ